MRPLRDLQKIWKSPFDPHLDQTIIQTIDNHMNSIPFWKE